MPNTPVLLIYILIQNEQCSVYNLDNLNNLDNVDYVVNMDHMDNIGQPKRQPKRETKKQPERQSGFLVKTILDKQIETFLRHFHKCQITFHDES